MRRVLLTGATGFIGRHVPARLAERGFEVHAVSSRPVGPERPPEPTWHHADLMDAGTAARLIHELSPTHLLHLAWYAEHGKFWTSPENERWLLASQRVLRAFAERGGSRAVLAGTCAEYDWTGEGVLSEESTPLRPVTPYGVAKHTLRLDASALAAEAGFSFAWGRIFFVYGPFEAPGRLVASIARALAAGKPALSSHGEQVRDFLHAADVASAFVELLDSKVEGAVNIGSGEGVAIKQVIALLAEAAGRRDLVRLGALNANPNEPGRLIADTTRLRTEVGWRPRRSLADGLAETLAWWRAELGVRDVTPT